MISYTLNEYGRIYAMNWPFTRTNENQRKNAHITTLSPELHQRLCESFDQRYKKGGKQRKMQEFLNDWVRKLPDDCQPPTRQTVSNFLKECQDREHWLIDGFCRLLLNCPVEEASQLLVSTIKPVPEGSQSPVSIIKTVTYDTVSPPPNPFGMTGRITNPANFYGREELLRQLFEELARGCSRSLIGDCQIGKSSILSMVCLQGPERLQLPQEAFIYMDMQTIRDEHQFFNKLCRKIGIESCRGTDLEFALEDQGQRYIICIDEIEKMTRKENFSGEERQELRGFADGSNMPFTLVIASRSPLDILFPDSEDGTSPLYNICKALDVKPFLPKEARNFLIHRLQGTDISFSEAEIEELIENSAGHPAKLQEQAAELFNRYRGWV